MKISLLTPILDRANWQPILQALVNDQTYPIHQWLICEELESCKAKKALGVPPLTHRTAAVEYVQPTRQLRVADKLNLLLPRVTGDLVIYWSSDDFYSPDYVESVVAEFTKRPTLQACSLTRMSFYSLPSRTYGSLYSSGSYSAALAHRSTVRESFVRRTKGEDRRFISVLKEKYNYRETESYTDKILIMVHGENLSTYAQGANHIDDQGRSFLRSRVANRQALEFYEGF